MEQNINVDSFYYTNEKNGGWNTRKFKRRKNGKIFCINGKTNGKYLEI